MTPLVDSHCHLNFEPLNADLEGVLQRALDNGVGHMLCVSVMLETFPEICALAHNHSNLSASVGVHPNEREGREPSVEDLTSRFDFINLSGLLYHVFSPLHVIASTRPLLKKNGLMIVSTNVINRPGYFMDFNARGNLQGEQNTFWYMSIPLLDYVLRYFRLLPLSCLFRPLITDDGYFSVICRATDEPALDE